MVEYFRFSRENKERTGTARHVFCVQVGRRFSLQGTPQTKEETNGNARKQTTNNLILMFVCFRVCQAKEAPPKSK